MNAFFCAQNVFVFLRAHLFLALFSYNIKCLHAVVCTLYRKHASVCDHNHNASEGSIATQAYEFDVTKVAQICMSRQIKYLDKP